MNWFFNITSIHKFNIKIYNYMIFQFIKHRHLLIWSSSTRIKCQLLPLILVVAAVEVSLANTSSVAVKSCSSTSMSSSSGHFYFLYFTWLIPIYIEWNSNILVICFHLFCRLDYIFLVTFILSFLSCWFRLSRLVDFVTCFFLLILWIVVTCFLFVLNYRLYGSRRSI